MATQCLRKARADFVNNTFASAFENNDTKPFWKINKAQRKGAAGIAPLKRDGQLFSDCPSKTDILNSQFSSVFTRDDISHIPSLPGPFSQIYLT